MKGGGFACVCACVCYAIRLCAPNTRSPNTHSTTKLLIPTSPHVHSPTSNTTLSGLWSDMRQKSARERAERVRSVANAGAGAGA